MNIYCWPHRTVHEFTFGDVEEILYSLTGQVGDADKSERTQDQNEYPTMICPKDALHLARDSEAYLEHVEQGVEGREVAA